MRRTPECKDYYVKIYSGAYPTDFGFKPRYTIAVDYNNSRYSESLNEYVCYLTENNDNIANLVIYGANRRNFYNSINRYGKIWGLEVSRCKWDSDFVDIYFELSDCWQDELPDPEDYHEANLYTFELEVNEIEFRKRYTPTNDGIMKIQWLRYCAQYDYMIEHKEVSENEEFTYPPMGIELAPNEYTYYTKNNFDLNRIHAWCMSGESAHEYMRHWIPSPGFTSDAPQEEVTFTDELGEYVPRAGFYKLIRRENNQNTLRDECQKYDFLICYYTRSRDLVFVEEEVKIYEGQLYNKLSSRGPLNCRLEIGQILHVRRTILDQYMYDGKVQKAYSVDWEPLYEKRLPAVYVGAISHASNMNEPGIKAILSKLYFKAIQMPWIDESGKFDFNSSKHTICFMNYESTGDLIIRQDELEKQIFAYNKGQLDTLRKYLSMIAYINNKTREIIDDLCNKSPIIAPYIVNRRFSARFSVSPPKYYKSENRNGYYVHYFNIFDYSTSSDRAAYAELIIEGVFGKEFSIRYRKPCANDYLNGIFII